MCGRFTSEELKIANTLDRIVTNINLPERNGSRGTKRRGASLEEIKGSLEKLRLPYPDGTLQEVLGKMEVENIMACMWGRWYSNSVYGNDEPARSPLGGRWGLF